MERLPSFLSLKVEEHFPLLKENYSLETMAVKMKLIVKSTLKISQTLQSIQATLQVCALKNILNKAQGKTYSEPHPDSVCLQ